MTWGVQDVVQKVQVKIEIILIKMNKIQIGKIIKKKIKKNLYTKNIMQ